MKIKSEEKQPNGRMFEQKFGCHTKSEVYMNKSSDMNELYEMLDEMALASMHWR